MARRLWTAAGAVALLTILAGLWGSCLLAVDYQKGPELPPAGGAGGAGGDRSDGGAAGAVGGAAGAAVGGSAAGGAAGGR